VVLKAPPQPFLEALLTRKARVWARASRITMRPIQRWRRLNVSKDMPRRLMSGLFRPDMRKSGIMLITERYPVRFRMSLETSLSDPEKSMVMTQKATLVAK
jgi:hypothetical protein